MRTLLLLTLVFVCRIIYAQDTITVMTYNLLNFNNNTSYCTQNNNPVNNKKGYLKTICQYVMPDIIGFNEIGANNANIQFILDSILNTGGSKVYGRIPYVNTSNTDIVSSVFYNTNKFALYSTNHLQTNLRDVIIANLYYKSLELESQQDTVFIRVIVAHLKAGSTTSDQQQRAQETQVIMNYLNSIGNIKNTILMGDLNVYSSTEQAFQNLINHSNINIRLYDPINKLGNWHDNSAFALYHTQAAQLNSNGCTSGGGLDDRFDFILTSFGIINNLYKVQYLQNSYKVIGQDGNRLNLSVDNPENYSVPNNVLVALANMSDHLPVSLKLIIHQTPQIGIEKNPVSESILYPISWNGNELVIKSEINEMFQISIYNSLGIKIFETKDMSVQPNFSIITPTNISNGIYFIEFKSLNFNKCYKFVKTN